jgi:hypothetical protein
MPELAGTEYGATPLRALLHMSSGVAFANKPISQTMTFSISYVAGE